MKLTAILATALAGVFGFLYVLQVNALTAQAYHIGEYETTKQQLSDHAKILEASAIRTLAMKNFEDLAAVMNFEKAHDISYLKIAEPAVATTSVR
jgi:hypothetical protein